MVWKGVGVGESRKVTYQLPEDLVREVREAVDDGYAASMSRFVEDAMRARLLAIARERLREDVRRAALDPMVARDIESVEDELKGMEEPL
jgi:Arc/MetJ-type ribon-helix-helix transcriptional regulator